MTKNNNKTETVGAEWLKVIDDIMLSKNTLTGVVVNARFNIIFFKGPIGYYLQHFPGRANHNLLKMARFGLAFELRSILQEAKTKNIGVFKENIPVKVNGSLKNVTIEAMPLPDTITAHYLVLFHEENIFGISPPPSAGNMNLSGQSLEFAAHSRISQLEKELAQLREDMRSMTEEQEAANEKLQTANEELLSGSEELQCLNEELETSKEELGITNEELTVVNNQMVDLNEAVTEARDYAQAIISTVREPLLVIRENGQIQSANAAFYETFRVNESETKGKLVYELGNGQWNIPALRKLLEEILPKKAQFSGFQVSHSFENIGHRIMLLNAREIIRDKEAEKLILLAIQDVTEEVLVRKRIEESEKRLRNLVHQAPTPILLLKGEDMIMVMANEPVFKIFNVKKEALGKPFLKILPEMKDQPFMKYLLDVFHNGNTHYGKEDPAYFIRENGVKETVYFNFVYQPYYEDDGSISGVMVQANDVSEQVVSRKKIEESEAHLRAMSDLMPAKITNADPGGGVTYCNKEWLDFTGLNFEDFKDFGYHNIMHPDEVEEFKRRFQKAAETGTDLEMEMRFMNTDGEYKWHLNRASSVRADNGDIKMWIGVTTEIQKIKEEEQRKSEFLKMISHELKTPVTSVKGYVQLLLKSINEEPEKILNSIPLKSSLIRIDAQIIRLTRLIGDILDLSRLEENKLELHLETFCLADLLSETIQDLLQISSNDIKLRKPGFRCNVHADRDRIGQVIINLLTNAIKYSPTNSPIEVQIHRSELNQVSVSIKDHGIGIDKQDQERVFERFYRAEGKNENVFSGFGIGLFIAHEIIKRHGGEIFIQSEKGAGSVFTFTLNGAY